MIEGPLVSVVIPCYNPTPFLHETLASVRAQAYKPIEIIVVNDGTDRPEALALLESIAGTVDRYLEQENRGLGGARNTGFRAARGEYVLPLDADDRILPAYIPETVAAIQAHPEAAFIYADHKLFGDVSYVERPPEYSLFALLEQNTLCYASLIRRADWESAGGYDESMRWGYEDWEFWLRLGERGRYGRRVPKVLFEYRKHGRSLFTVAQEHHEQIVEHIRARHPQLFSKEGRRRLKVRWAPSVCVLGPELAAEQTIEDWHRLPTLDTRVALEQSNAAAFLVPAPAGPADPRLAELAALAVWAGHAALRLPDGSHVLSRAALARQAAVSPRATAPAAPAQERSWGRFERLRRHLVNAELTSLDAWRKRPLRTAGRLIPLAVKERVNRAAGRAAGRAVFDLSFYLRFQPNSVLVGDVLVEPLEYLTRPKTARGRLALVTPHLGPGGAESVLLEVARAVDRTRWELLLIATQSQDSRWLDRWRENVDHVYDLAAVAPPDQLVPALYFMAVNWELDAALIQNSLAAYSAIPNWRQSLPTLRIVDLVHAVDPRWDFVSATRAVASQMDLRVAISDAGRRRLLDSGVPPEKVRLVRNGIDLDRFYAAPPRATGKILYAGRLDPVKRPLLLADIAAELARLRPQRDFRFVVAGDGPEAAALRRRVEPTGLFTLLGMVDDVPALLADADVVVVPSEAEGIPLIALEALAMQRPVVCARAGAVAEAVTAETGVLIDPGPREAVRFAAAIHELLNDPQRRRALGEGGRRRVEADYNRARAQQAYRELF